jgi:hypothetical protein
MITSIRFLNFNDDLLEKGGKLKPAKSLVQIAKEKGVTMTYAFEQLKKGMGFEKEHSDDKKVQKTIALQHLDENIDYYKKLAKMESSFKKGGQTFNDKELLAKYKRGESIGFTGIAHLKAKGLIARADGHKKKSAKYMEKGGDVGQEVVCHNCGWHWNTNDSEEYDKYVCHKCGFDNTLFYSNNIMEKGGIIYKKIYNKGGGGYTTIINGMLYNINKQYDKGTY